MTKQFRLTDFNKSDPLSGVALPSVHYKLALARRSQAAGRISINLHNAIESVDSFAFSFVTGFSLPTKYSSFGHF